MVILVFRTVNITFSFNDSHCILLISHNKEISFKLQFNFKSLQN